MGAVISGETVWRRSRIVVRPAPPAAGADWSLQVPAGHVYVVESVYAVLTTSATVANRQPNLVVSDGVGSFLTLPPQGVQAASLAWSYAWYEAAALYALGTAQVVPIPTLHLGPSWSLATSTAAIAAGDQWSGIAVRVRDVTVRGGPNDLDELPDLRVEVVEMGPTG